MTTLKAAALQPGREADEQEYQAYEAAECSGNIIRLAQGEVALLLGAAGLLRDRRAACHWAWRDQLALFGATPDPARVAERLDFIL